MPPWLIAGIVTAVFTLANGLLLMFVKRREDEFAEIKEKVAAIEDALSMQGNRAAELGRLDELTALLHDQVRSVEQELYGATKTNGWRKRLNDLDEEQIHQGALAHWMANLLTVVADKSGVQIRQDRPKRGDQRR